MSDTDESDSDFSEDDAEFMAEMREKRIKDSKARAMAPIKIIKGAHLSHDVLKGIVQTFNRNPQARVCIADYIARGSEINAMLRSGDYKIYKSTITCLDEHAVPLKTLLKTTEPYTILYRSMQTEYSPESSIGYTSTADRLLTGFGKYWMKIYIPTSVKVLVGDITDAVKTPLSSDKITTYEIILPRGLQLLDVGKVGNTTYYAALGDDEDVMVDMIEQIKSYVRNGV